MSEQLSSEASHLVEHHSGPSRFRHWFLFWPVVVYLISRLLVLIAVIIDGASQHHGLLQGLDGWDGKWFLAGASSGWPSTLPMVNGHVAQNTTAFFPLLPLLMRGVHFVTTLSFLIAGLVLSAGTGLSAVLGVGYLTRSFTDERRALRAALFFVVFPGTLVFSLIYSEGLAITCVAFGLIALLNKKWWLAGVLGAIASASSPIAFVFALSALWCAYYAIKEDRDWWALVAPLLAPMGGVLWFLYLWQHTGTLSAWRSTERGGWQSYPSLMYPIHIVWNVISNPVSPTMTGYLLFVGIVAGGFGIYFAVREHQPPPVLIYGIGVVAMVAISAPVGLRPRFLMMAFPLVIAIGTRFKGKVYVALLGVSTLLLTAVSIQALTSYAVFP